MLFPDLSCVYVAPGEEAASIPQKPMNNGEMGGTTFLGMIKIAQDRTKAADGAETAAKEYQCALEAVNFMLAQQTGYLIPIEEKGYHVGRMIEYAGRVARERGYALKLGHHWSGVWIEMNIIP